MLFEMKTSVNGILVPPKLKNKAIIWLNNHTAGETIQKRWEKCQRNVSIFMLIVPLFIVTVICAQFKCPSLSECMMVRSENYNNPGAVCQLAKT